MSSLRTLLVAGMALFAAMPAFGEPPCDDVAARLRADPAFTATGSHAWPLDALAKQSFAELATSSDKFDGDAGEDEYLRALAAKYGMDQALTAAIKSQINFEENEVWSLTASSVHAFTNMAGTAHCQSFVFFAGGRKLPDPPPSMYGGMSGDPAPPIVECYMSEGRLARIGGKLAFVVTDRDAPHSFDLGLRIAPFKDGRWGAACKVEARFETLYRVKHIFRAKDAALTEIMLARLAPAIARARDRATAAKTAFAYGAKLPTEDAARLLKLAEKLGFDQTIPSFGATLDRDEETAPGSDGDDLPVAIGGKPYLLRIAHPAIGWRDLTGYLLVFYREEGDALVPVASIVLDEDRGRLTEIKSVALAP